MQIVIDIPEEEYEDIINSEDCGLHRLTRAIANGTPLTPNVLADALMEERIRGELKQDISYSKDIIDNVKCTLTVSIRDRRPCYCGAELREVWRESEEQEDWHGKRSSDEKAYKDFCKDYLKHGAESLAKDHPDLVRDIWNCKECEHTEDAEQFLRDIKEQEE